MGATSPERNQMKTNMRVLISGCALAVLALSGCKREATGQVAAVVDGEEITLAELNQEIGASQPADAADKQAVQREALQKIIDRRLIAQVAREDGIDKQPEYLARERQANELLLIQMFGQKLNRASRMPDAAAIDKYIADNPTLFAERTLFSIDRIQFQIPSDPAQLQAIKDDHSMDAVAARLNSMGIKFERGPAVMDSAQMPPQVLARIRALPQGEPFGVPSGRIMTVAVINGSEPRPLVGAEARPIALERLRLQNLESTMADRLKTARAAARIEYQDGFAPAPAASPGASPAPAGAAKKGA
jgi:peptidyl-prolyl cis-trans isomerase C